MNPMIPVAAIALSLAACGFALNIQQGTGRPGTAQSDSTPTSLDIRVSPIIDMHFFVRRLAASDAQMPSLEGLDRILGTLEDFERSIGGSRGWLVFEGNLLDCMTAADLVEVFSKLPETRQRRGQTVELRAPAVAYAEALAAAEPSYLATIWPEHKQVIDTGHQSLRAMLDRQESACLQRMISALGMDDPHAAIPVYLMADGPFPGAYTAATVDDRPVCFVATTSVDGTLLLETVLHEATHGLDILTRGQPTALNRLRDRLGEANISQQDPRFRDCWHTIMFINAGEVVRRVVDPAHVHYGDAEAYYPKVQRIAEIERPIWTEYLDGKLTLDQTVDKLIDGLRTLPIQRVMPRPSVNPPNMPSENDKK